MAEFTTFISENMMKHGQIDITHYELGKGI